MGRAAPNGEGTTCFGYLIPDAPPFSYRFHVAARLGWRAVQTAFACPGDHGLPLALDSIRLAWHTIGIQGDADVMFVTLRLTAQPIGCTVGQLFGSASLRYPCPPAVYPGFPTPARDHSRRAVA